MEPDRALTLQHIKFVIQFWSFFVFLYPAICLTFAHVIAFIHIFESFCQRLWYLFFSFVVIVFIFLKDLPGMGQLFFAGGAFWTINIFLPLYSKFIFYSMNLSSLALSLLHFLNQLMKFHLFERTLRFASIFFLLNA